MSRFPPLLLIHGALGSASQMAPLQRELAVDRDVVVVEVEGHGETPMSGDRYDIDRFVTAVRDARRAHGLDRVDLVGYSMGGYVALRMAGLWPAEVATVTTLGTKLEWTPDVASRETSRLNPAAIRAKVPAFASTLQERHRGAGGWEAVLGRTAALMTELGAQPTVDAPVLLRIEARVQLMVGDRDAVVSVEETRAAARTVPRGSFAVLPDTPHPIEQVRHALVAALVRDFVARG